MDVSWSPRIFVLKSFPASLARLSWRVVLWKMERKMERKTHPPLYLSSWNPSPTSMPSTFFVQWNSEAHFNSKGFGCAFLTPHSHSGAEFEGSSGFDLFNVYGNNPQLPASIFWLKSEHFWPNPEISAQKTATYASTQQQTNYREIQLTITESVLRTCPKKGTSIYRGAQYIYMKDHILDSAHLCRLDCFSISIPFPLITLFLQHFFWKVLKLACLLFAIP